MADILPFCGLRFDERLAGPLDGLIAPPYDVIDESLYHELRRLSPYNVVRLILPGAPDEDGRAPAGTKDDYAETGDLLRNWQARGLLRREEKPALYVYEQTYEAGGERRSRTGLVALVRLVAPGEGILPHERTHAGPRADRLNLLSATKANLGQIFALYDDPHGEMAAFLEEMKDGEPRARAEDADGGGHRLWAVTDRDSIARATQALRGRDLVIADGHHRYETALTYHRRHPRSRAAAYRMMTLVALSDPGLTVLPIHRLVHDVPGFDRDTLPAALGRDFEVTAYPGGNAAARDRLLQAMAARQREGRHAFGLYLGDERHHLAVLRDRAAMDAAGVRCAAWKDLDVAVVHTLVLEKVLGLGRERPVAQHVIYVSGLGDAVSRSGARVDRGECQALFLLNPTRVDDVAEVARAGERMPEKSTFFYPKVYTGLVMRLLDDGEIPPGDPGRGRPRRGKGAPRA